MAKTEPSISVTQSITAASSVSQVDSGLILAVGYTATTISNFDPNGSDIVLITNASSLPSFSEANERASVEQLLNYVPIVLVPIGNLPALLTGQEKFAIRGVCTPFASVANINLVISAARAVHAFYAIGVTEAMRVATSGNDMLSKITPGSAPSGVILLGPEDNIGDDKKVCASVRYWQSVAINRGVGREFYPVFGQVWGKLNYVQPVKLLTADQRNSLLSSVACVDWVRFDSVNGYYYLNQNWTPDSEDSPTAEENVTRLFLKVSADVKKLCEQFIARPNTKKTRDLLRDTLVQYLQVVFQGDFAPTQYSVACDSTNNDSNTIASRTLNVTVSAKYPGSVKSIVITNHGELYIE